MSKTRNPSTPPWTLKLKTQIARAVQARARYGFRIPFASHQTTRHARRRRLFTENQTLQKQKTNKKRDAQALSTVASSPRLSLVVLVRRNTS